MYTLTTIFLDDGEFALYINGHYLGSEDLSGENYCLAEIAEKLSRLPGVVSETACQPVPENDDWRWDDIAADVFPAGRQHATHPVTVAGMMARLRSYPADTLCVGTFWLAEDFRALAPALTDEEVEAAMEIAQDRHDCNNGYNWDFLEYCIGMATS